MNRQGSLAAYAVHLTTSHHVGVDHLTSLQAGWVPYTNVFWERGHIHITFALVYGYNCSILGVPWLASLVEHATLDLEAVSLSPTLDVEITLKIKP